MAWVQVVVNWFLCVFSELGSTNLITGFESSMSDLNKHKWQPASKLTDPDNIGDIEQLLTSSPIASTCHSTVTVEDVDEDAPLDEDKPAAKKLKTTTARAWKDAKKAQQSMLDDVVEEKERVVPYLDTLLQEAAEDWLIATNQPIDVLSHHEFKTMIDVASQAHNGIKILDKHTTRENIVARFWQIYQTFDSG
ncbi:hypothetical protein H1R20_g9559, partial [Candolleomyces eurysporus]